VIAFGDEVFSHHRGALLSFVQRPQVARDEVVLPDEVLDGIERQVIGVAKHASRLLASGQHLRRGVLLYGVPGTGKTHMVRYLLGRLPGVTAVLLSGRALGMISEACSVARALQPSVIVVEDVDLIAEERERYMGDSPLLFELLNEMGLYRGNLELDLHDLETVIARTDGVTASFIKELLRRAALQAAESDEAASDQAGGDAPITVTDAAMTAALDQLLDTRSALTQVLLGGAARGKQAPG
jgi:hypothetical protein